MLTKLLLTIMVVVGAWLVLRHRQAGRRPPFLPSTPPPPPPIELGRPSPMKALAWGLVAMLLLASAWWLFDTWFDGRRVVEVQVINANTGTVTRYDARKAEVDLKGGAFTTLSGRRVVLAAVERMELETAK